MLKTYLKVMKALADGNRVRIIKMLQVREMCVCELRAALELAQPSVSKHLRILEEAGLVERRKDGPWVNYRLPDAADSIYAAQMQVMVRQWLNEDEEIALLMRQATTIDRSDISGRCP
jgi:ArsR family transcriptional regulator